MAFDPDAYLGGEVAPTTETKTQTAETKTTSAFDPDAYVAEGTKSAGEPYFLPTRIPGPTGISGSAIKETLSPLASVGKGIASGYKANPAGAVADAVLMHGGIPPMFGGFKGFEAAKDAYNAAKTSSNIAQGLASKIAETPGVEASFNKLIDALPKAEALRMNDLIAKRGAQGLKEFIDSSTGAIKSMPEVKELAGLVPSRMEQVGKVVGPAVRGLSKVLGPAAAAYEGTQAYDKFQKGDYTGAALHGLSGATAMHPIGLIAQPAIAMMQNARENFNQQTPQQQQESAMSALSGEAPGMAGEGLAMSQPVAPQAMPPKPVAPQNLPPTSPYAPPTATNFIERIKMMAKQYGLQQ